MNNCHSWTVGLQPNIMWRLIQWYTNYRIITDIIIIIIIKHKVFFTCANCDVVFSFRTTKTNTTQLHKHTLRVQVKLRTVISTIRWAVITVLWIGICHTGHISLCVDLFLFICVYFVSLFDAAWLLYYCERSGVYLAGLKSNPYNLNLHCWLGHCLIKTCPWYHLNLFGGTLNDVVTPATTPPRRIKSTVKCGTLKLEAAQHCAIHSLL